MLGALAVLVCSAVLTDLVGYWLHRMIHQRWTGPMFRAHMTHHLVKYPPTDVFSRTYRSAGWDSLAVWFSPFFVALAAGYILLGGPHPWIAVLGSLADALASSYAHDLTHIRGSIVWTLNGLTKDVAVRHHAHHFKMRKNFGILVPWWDGIFRTRARRSGGASPRRRRPLSPGPRGPRDAGP